MPNSSVQRYKSRKIDPRNGAFFFEGESETYIVFDGESESEVENLQILQFFNFFKNSFFFKYFLKYFFHFLAADGLAQDSSSSGASSSASRRNAEVDTRCAVAAGSVRR